VSTPIKDCLQTLSRHSEVIEQGMGGEISMETGTPSPVLVQLRQASAVRPAGEDGFRLHPRLREYLSDHLQLFSSYQSLAEIGSKIGQMQALWNELDDVRDSGDRDITDALHSLIQTTVFDIAHALDSNILFLQTRLSTRYGNVKSLDAKKSQNRWYQKQTAQLAGDLNRLAREAERIERHAEERGIAELSNFLRRYLIARILPWQQGLSEMQTLIRKEIFRTREVETNHKLLARMDLLLRQQPAWRGFEADLPEEIPAFLLAARLKPFRPHAEPLDGDRSISQEMELLARNLPPKKIEVEQVPPQRYKRVIDPPRKPPETAAALMLERLLKDLHAAGGKPVSLRAWRERDQEIQETMTADMWLVFSMMALRSRKVRVELIRNPPKLGEHFSHTFCDAVVQPKGGIGLRPTR